jgi:DNA polymerase III subunit alpha
MEAAFVHLRVHSEYSLVDDLVRFYQAALAAGVRNPDDANNPYRLVLLVQNQAGYKNLTRLVSRSYRENQHPLWFDCNEELK